MIWRKVVSGTYITGDGAFKIQRSFDGNMRPNGWQLLQRDGDGWQWLNTYPVIDDAKDAAEKNAQ